MILAAREVIKTLNNTIPLEFTPVIEEISNVFLEDLLNRLPPMRPSSTQIKSTKLAILPNEPTIHAELKRQIDELVDKGFIRESMSPCVVNALLTPKKKDGS